MHHHSRCLAGNNKENLERAARDTVRVFAFFGLLACMYLFLPFFFLFLFLLFLLFLSFLPCFCWWVGVCVHPASQGV